MAPIKLGVVGLSLDGWFKDAHLPCLEALSDSYTLTAAATSRQESADQVGKHYHIKSYGGSNSAEQLAKDAEVEMVVVAVKTPLHKQVAMHAVHAGKPVFIEWPLGNGLEEAIELAEAARKKGIRTMIGLQARQDPAIRMAKEMLEGKKIGRILSTTMTGYGGSWGEEVQQRDAYTLDDKNGTTIISIAFGHFVDALVYLLGDFDSLAAYKATTRTASTIIETGEKVRATAPDQLVVQGQLQSGALVAVHYKGGLQPPGSEGLVWEIEGDRGVMTFKADGVGHVQASRTQRSLIVVPNPAFSQLIRPELYLNGEQVHLPEDKLTNVGRLYEAFAKDDKSGYNDWDHAVRNHRILDAVERSIKEGKRQSYV